MSEPSSQQGAHQAPKPAPAAQGQQESKDFRGIVRLLGRDLKGQMPLSSALTRLKGIGRNFANALSLSIERELGIKPSMHVGELSDKQLESVEVILKEPAKHGVVSYLLNRQRDPETGVDTHVVQSDLQFVVKRDVEREKDSKSWKGWRHSLGQRVRGQHTRTTGRTGLTVGVIKKAFKAQKSAGGGAAAAPADKAAAKPAEKK